MTDLVNNPQHYQAGNGIEAIDVIEGFLKKYDHRDQVVKYNLRAGDKGNFLQDLEKSAWYLNRTIENFKAGKLTDNQVVLEDPEESTPKPEKLAIYKDEDDDYWAIGNDGLWRWYFVFEDYDVDGSAIGRTWDYMVGHHEVNLCSSEESDRVEPLIRKYQEEKGH